LLLAHRPLDEREQAALRQMLELIESPGDPFRRDRFDPGHFTASAFVLAPERDALLEVHHAKLGRWLQPGGHVEPEDESIAAAARREVLEETGLADLEAMAGVPAPYDLDVHLIPAHRAEPAHLHFDVRFLFLSRSRDAQAGPEARAIRWQPLSLWGQVSRPDPQT
jgi:8-oxo-dGTP pyrophosphatase MutT (NUDIX family)